jgi:hypothetical protein
MAGLSISLKQVERQTKRIGQERVEQRTAAVEAFLRRPLVEKEAAADPTRPCPQVAVVSIDGGRLQIRGSDSAEDDSSHGRGSKIAFLETYASKPSDVDPDPDVPRCLLDLGRSVKLVHGLGHALPAGLESDEIEATETESTEPLRPCRRTRPERPQRLVRRVLASRSESKDFGPIVQQAAWRRNFFAAPRNAFLGDGQACNWTIHRKHFPQFVVILDFVPALSYVFAAALAGRSLAEAFEVYVRWIQQVWAGQVESLLPELERRSGELGVAPKEAPASDPRKLVSESLTSLRNNASRIRYDEYRRRGLPILTSAVESAIKQINHRVKGSEKFWSEPGAEAVLQLRTDYLSETLPMEKFWEQRQSQATGNRRYRKAL